MSVSQSLCQITLQIIQTHLLTIFLIFEILFHSIALVFTLAGSGRTVDILHSSGKWVTW